MTATMLAMLLETHVDDASLGGSSLCTGQPPAGAPVDTFPEVAITQVHTHTWLLESSRNDLACASGGQKPKPASVNPNQERRLRQQGQWYSKTPHSGMLGASNSGKTRVLLTFSDPLLLHPLSPAISHPSPSKSTARFM